ncbi:hypothetical protein FOA52_007466 [Chlamydomonas sp. UWO 241]|nr:hypothetical protein FOA52_007466 [Chlamydomonas sp. UWO 241]
MATPLAGAQEAAAHAAQGSNEDHIARTTTATLTKLQAIHDGLTQAMLAVQAVAIKTGAEHAQAAGWDPDSGEPLPEVSEASAVAAIEVAKAALKSAHSAFGEARAVVTAAGMDASLGTVAALRVPERTAADTDAGAHADTVLPAAAPHAAHQRL